MLPCLIPQKLQYSEREPDLQRIVENKIDPQTSQKGNEENKGPLLGAGDLKNKEDCEKGADEETGLFNQKTKSQKRSQDQGRSPGEQGRGRGLGRNIGGTLEGHDDDDQRQESDCEPREEWEKTGPWIVQLSESKSGGSVTKEE